MQDSAAVSAELARIESAMTRIRLRTETTGEIIEDVATAVENMVTDTGAFKVSSIEEMNALEDMQEGDYCVINNYAEYTIPTNATFTKFTDEPSRILNNEYSHYLFLIKPRWANSELNIFFNTENYSNYTGTATLYSVKNTNIPKSNGVHTTNPNENPHYVFTFEKYNGQIYLKTLANNYITTIYTDYLKNQTSKGFYIKNITKDSNNYYKFQISTGDKYLQAYSYDGSKIQMRNNASGTDFDIYACRMETTTIDHLVYQYRSNAWVDVTDDILVPTTNVTPTTSSQTLTIPAGYKGFKTVNVNAVDNTIDANIVAGNIKNGVSILGVTGTVIPDVDTHAYKVTTTEEMNAITTMSNGDYCIIEGIPEYVMPQGEVTFTRFTGNPSDLLNGTYNNGYLFILQFNPIHTNGIFSTNEYIDRYHTNYGIRTYPGAFTKTNDTYKADPTNSSKKPLIFKTLFINNRLYFVDLNNYSFKKNSTNGLLIKNSIDVSNDNYVSNITKSSNDNSYKIYLDVGGDSKQISTNGDQGGFLTMDLNDSYFIEHFGCSFNLYYYKLQSSTVDHLVYQYRQGSGWVDVTDDILVPTTNVTPSTSPQTVVIPAGYRGLKDVNISAVTSSIDQNIQAGNILSGTTILGVTGSLVDYSSDMASLKTILELDPSATAQDVIDAVTNLKQTSEETIETAEALADIIIDGSEEQSGGEE